MHNRSTGNLPVASSDWRPTASWPALRRRAELLRRAREFFDDRGFLEVETPLLSADTVVDRHLDPIGVTLSADPLRPEHGPRCYLQTSPEFHMKRLLAAGGEAIYQITRAFRAAERGKLHNPEFTMLEWYRTGDDYHAGMHLLDELSAVLLADGSQAGEPCERITYRDAFRRHVELDPLTVNETQLRQACEQFQLQPPQLDVGDRDGWLDFLLTELVQPNLGSLRPSILYDYPASQGALARVRQGDPPVAERFELYFRGVELANGYHELLDPHELRQRNIENNRQRQQDGKAALPEDSRLLAAMQHGLPACTGVALGFDRLVMLALGASSIDDVLTFPFDRA